VTPAKSATPASAAPARPVADRAAALPAAAPAEAVDPVCGMTVPRTAAAVTASHRGVAYAFCGAGCRDRFTAAPARYLASQPS
jgi:xanthine dehydrogenase accessory factor